MRVIQGGDRERHGVARALVHLLAMPPQKGDVAIGVGAIKLLREALPDVHIVGVADGLDPANSANVEAFLDTYEVQELIRWPAGSEPAAGCTPRRGALGRAAVFVRRHGWSLLNKLHALGMVRLFGRRGLRLVFGDAGQIARAVGSVGLVVLRGGGYVASPHLVSDITGLRLGALYVLNLARALGVPYAIWGHTFFDLNGPRSMPELSPVIADSIVTICRESRSLEYLSGLGAPRERLVVLPDTAFSLKPGPADRRRTLLEAEGLAAHEGRLLGVNVRALWGETAARERLVDRQLDAVEQTVRLMREKYGAIPVLLPHGLADSVFELPGPEQDRRPLEMLLERLARDGEAFLLRGSHHPTDLVTLYSAFEAMVSSRLHVGILAACGGVPSVGIAYQRTKTFGIAQMMGLDDYVVDLGSLDADALTQTVELLWSQRQELRQRLLDETLPGIRKQLRDYTRLTLAEVCV